MNQPSTADDEDPTGLQPVIALRALEHHAYCPRQCTLIHGDGVWSDNQHTVRGVRAHRRVDQGRHSRTRNVQVLRAIPLWSELHGLTGRADVVEVHRDGTVVPVEHKAGIRHGRAADLQLCAQGLCLEEMLGVAVTYGDVWYGGPRRRTRVELNSDLRQATLGAIADIRANLRARGLPEAPNDQRCSDCQLRHHCLPDVVGTDTDWLQRTIDELYRCDT